MMKWVSGGLWTGLDVEKKNVCVLMAILELHLSETLDEMLDIRKTFLIPCYPGSSGSVEFPTLPSAFVCVMLI